jgi:hypothetical protein
MPIAQEYRTEKRSVRRRMECSLGLLGEDVGELLESGVRSG